MSNAISVLESLTVIDMDAGTVLSGQPSGNMVRGFSTSSMFTPTVNSNYVFHESSRDLVVWFITASDPLYVYGPCGSGKSSCLKQLAAKLNYPVFEVTGHSRLEFPELIGHHTIRRGSMEFEYGPLALTMKYGGLFLLNGAPR
jgi:cobaltochelatase CobS